MTTGPSRIRPRLLDGAVAVGVAAMTLVSGLSGQHPSTALGLPGCALLAASGLILTVRRRAPVAVLAATGLFTVGYLALGFGSPALGYLFAVFTAVRAGHRVAALGSTVLLLVAIPAALMVSVRDWSLAEAVAGNRDVLQLAWLVAAGAAGEALRQADRRAGEAERNREETALRRAGEERLHIARELHDSLTHQISVIKLQAEVAVHLARKRGEQVPAALLAIQEAGREASRELRATLETLRDDDATPPRGLDQLPDLVDRARAMGLDATLTVEGRRREVPTPVDRAAYRIVQESLTNVARHAAAASASVRVDYRPDVLAVTVEDDGAATSDPVTPGTGLLGMRERVAALGGRLHARPRPEGGFAVHAELPMGRTL
ncbi:sensor histidine kinase [Longispora urticae]